MLTGTVKSAFHSASDLYEQACVVDRVASGIRAFGYPHFLTLICGRVQNGSLDFVNAGHPPSILMTQLVQTFSNPLGRSSRPRSIFRGEQRTIRFKRGCDRSVLFTDALIEAEAESGQYGVDRLFQKVQKGPMDGKTLAGQILESVRQFMVGWPINDDLTLVIADL